MIYGHEIKVKMWSPRILLNSVKYAFLAWIGVKDEQLTLNDVTFSAVKTVKKTIGGVGVEDCDFNFATADNVTEQVINLGAIVPAHARVLDVSTRTEVAFAHAATAIASWSVDTNVATINTAAAHGLATGNSVVIAGMTETALNGTYSITRTSNTAFTFSKTHADATTTLDATGTVTFSALAFVAETGNTSSGNQYIGSATIKALDAITACAAGAALAIAPSASAVNVYVAATPDGKYDHITAGRLAVFVTYIEAI